MYIHNAVQVRKILYIEPEVIRIVAYVNFWLMVLFAYTITGLFVDEELIKNSPLVETFGYNNICILWDFPPSRVATAMFYPLVEIPLLLYVVFNFLRIKLAQRDFQLLTKIEYTIAMIFFPIIFLLFLFFRMIFVIEAFEDVIGHTLGFHGLMIGLSLVSIQNFVYNKATETMSIKPSWLPATYLISLISVTVLKIVLVWSIFLDNPLLNPKTSIGGGVMQTLDIIWMLLAAVTPLGLAIYQKVKHPNTLYFILAR